MNLDIAVLLPWILAPVLVLAVAVYASIAIRKERARVAELTREQNARDEALERFASQTVPSITDAVRRRETPSVSIEVPVELQDSRFAQVLNWAGERYADGLRLVQVETTERVTAEAETRTRQAVAEAEAAVRSTAREATNGAVRSFGTAVVSLGADVSQVVSMALRQHRGDDVYATLTHIDHTVQQMIRQAQSYVIVCGGLPGRRWPAQVLTDIVGGATGRVRDYLRVRANQSDRVVISRAVEPLVHTMATLLDNGLRYSPPTSFVDVTFQEGHHGVTIIVDDAGVRMNAEQMEEARQVLAGERSVDVHQLGPSPKVGFPGIAALARRYGFTVYIDGPNAYGGMRAMVYIPEALLQPRKPGDAAEADEPIREVIEQAAPEREPVAVVAAPRSDQGEEKQFAVHEITQGGLPKRRRRTVAAPVTGARPRRSDAEGTPGRPDIAAAWHAGSKSGRAAATDHTEGTTP
ncbi:ATP-binding protein [Nocardia higoensis]|uniref:ATP-binding protein n=1 Tax=Nocardia higoensis TaxID=228599 RepID=UPI0002D8DE54|nr:ATP-binding protein [Nocardia higoensis]